MEEKPKSKKLITLSDAELFVTIKGQDTFIGEMTHKQQEEYKRRNGRYTLTKGDISLGYFGAKHIFEPGNVQFVKIRKDFQLFIKGRNKKSILVLVEGAIPSTTPDIAQDIHATGERGFITHLAKDLKIKVECLEPNRVVEMNYLLRNFKPDDIEYYYYLRGIRDYFLPGKILDATTFNEYSQQLLNQHRKMFQLLPSFSDFDFSLEHMKKIHSNITGENFDVDRRLDVNPRKQTTVIGQIAHATSSFRDFYHVRKIESCLTQEYSVFVVNGEDHAVIQRPVLEKMFQSENSLTLIFHVC